MKAKVTYLSELRIPKDLPHGEDKALDEDDFIYWDSVYPDHDGLVLQSLRGTTVFPAWEDKGDHYLIPANTTATYSGAYAALNAVWGVQFPDCVIEDIKSSYGRFKTLWAYRLARRALQMVKTAEANGTIPALQRVLMEHGDSNGNFLT